MVSIRFAIWTQCVLGCVLLSSSGIANAQDALPTKPQAAFDEMNSRRDARGMPPEDVPRVRAQFLLVAKYYADLINNPTVYRASLDPKSGPGVPKIPSIDRDRDTGILSDIDRLILIPTPTSKINTEKLDYINEVGRAFDAALKQLIENNGAERIARINATRVLAEVCRSGANAHWPTVAGLLKDPKTYTEIKYFALQAAANLLAAYDPGDYKSRAHSFHTPDPLVDAKQVGDLVQAIMNCVTNPSALLPDVAKVSDATTDQVAVLGYVRRQAVRALSQVRFVTVPGPDGREAIYPAYTLARVCVSDPVLVPSPSPSECGEAVIGLMNMAPAVKGFPVKGYNIEGIVEAITAGLSTFAAPRADATDRSLPWRHYSVRLAEAVKNWQPLFDPTFEATQPNSYDKGAVPAVVNDLIARIKIMVLEPIDKVGFDGKTDVGSKVDIEGLKLSLNQMRNNPNRKPLVFTNNPSTVLYMPEKK